MADRSPRLLPRDSLSSANSDQESDERHLQLAATVLEQLQALDDLGDHAAPEEMRPLLRILGRAALELLQSIDGNATRLAELDQQFEVLGPLLEVPSRLGAARETELAVRVAEALQFCAPDDMKGQIALAHAQAGDREHALELVLANLETAQLPFIAEFRAGDVYRELGETDAAEAYYRRSFALASTPNERTEASLRIASLLIDGGRETEAVAFLSQQRAARATSAPAHSPSGSAGQQLPRVGRNDPCPCGSGKKYKKCHGT